ncbi:hypothetical protein KSP40_PGU008431 [Platanthera guangdongensis]|uniref:Uncharacterized protein n=1 Tax=Platanthera guangdongensis TaxID=2320717 RepID=A0ABR2LDW1_9ASPA
MAQEGAVNTEQINGDSSKAVTFISFKPQLVLPKAEEGSDQVLQGCFRRREISRVNHPNAKLSKIYHSSSAQI